MPVPREEGALGAWALALALLVLALPVFNPDLFWHLSAGRWIWEHGRIPDSDPFSFARAGARWIDFEWLAQLAWLAAERAGGLWGAWALKAALLAAAYLPVDGLLRDKGVPAVSRAAALGLWSAAVLHQADLRVDLLSAIFFAVLLRRLESRRHSYIFGFGLFALWANLHAGFVMGFGLYAAYCLAGMLKDGRPSDELLSEALGAALGTLLNPYGFALYQAILAHLDASVPGLVAEWGAAAPARPFQWPFFAVLPAAAAAAWAARRRAAPLAGIGLALAAATLASARFGVFFAAAAAALLGTAFQRPKPRLVAAGLLTVSLLVAAATRRVAWGRPFSDAYVARRAVEFVLRERGALGGLRLFNAYEWGGYLGWRLGPDGKVFGDGRYLFHEQIAEIREALTAPERLAAFAARYRLDAFLIPRYPGAMPSERVYPDGTRRTLLRPWHAFFFPRERWALVYWDEQALLFVDRAKVPAAWLAGREYRLMRPGDREAVEDSLARGEFPREALEAEAARQRADAAPLP